MLLTDPPGGASISKHIVDLPSNIWRKLAEESMIAARQRITGPRRAILDWIAAVDTPFTAETVVSALAEQGFSSRPTIYRTVDWLRSVGWIARVQADAPDHAYVRLLPGHYHPVVCERCGKTLVIAGCSALADVRSALHKRGFEVHTHVLELRGLCEHCRDSNETVHNDYDCLA